MSEKHQATVRRVFEEVWGKGRLDGLEAILTNDIAVHDPMEPTKGLNAYKDAVRKYRTAFPDLRFDIDELLSVSDKVVARWHATGTHRGPLETLPPTGRQATITGISILRFSGDRICEQFDNWDALGMMQQLGVVTLPGKAAGAGA